MSTTTNIRLIATRREILRLFVCCALLTGVAYAQTNQTQPADARAKDNLAAAMDRLKHGSFFGADVNRIADARAVEAIPDLKKQFAITKDEISKEAIASALVRFGVDQEGVYWDYLVKGALDAIENDVPYPNGFDSKGRLMPEPSPEFTTWAKTYNLTTDAAEEAATRDLPSKVLYLAESRDRRAIPLLQRALSSPNFLIQASGAQGLAKLQDKPSIPLIIATCRRAPTDAAFTIAANSLARFDDPEAKSAAKEFMPAKEPK